jgi:hypothetical protein
MASAASGTTIAAPVGFHESNDLVAVSRFHCEVTIDAGGARVRDLESRNGTVLDGVVAELERGAPALEPGVRPRVTLRGRQLLRARGRRQRDQEDEHTHAHPSYRNCVWPERSKWAIGPP